MGAGAVDAMPNSRARPACLLNKHLKGAKKCPKIMFGLPAATLFAAEVDEQPNHCKQCQHSGQHEQPTPDVLGVHL